VYYFTKFLDPQEEAVGLICMRWIDGVDLDTLLKGKWELEERLTICRKMVDTVKTLHEHGIVHGDLYPKNWMLLGGDLYLIDFGGGNFTTPVRAAQDATDLDTLKISLTCLAYRIADWNFAEGMLAFLACKEC
jgi:tRNA A-37 threonylcarbamoyl transferase component Bud32